jgi:hypothetical protein
MRVLSDEQYRVGTRLDLEVMLPDGGSVRCWAEVVWTVPLGGNEPASFDLGLQFTDMAPSDIQRIASVLERTG